MRIVSGGPERQNSASHEMWDLPSCTLVCLSIEFPRSWEIFRHHANLVGKVVKEILGRGMVGNGWVSWHWIPWVLVDSHVVRYTDMGTCSAFPGIMILDAPRSERQSVGFQTPRHVKLVNDQMTKWCGYL
jgi:hypothetical protein